MVVVWLIYNTWHVPLRCTWETSSFLQVTHPVTVCLNVFLCVLYVETEHKQDLTSKHARKTETRRSTLLCSLKTLQFLRVFVGPPCHHAVLSTINTVAHPVYSSSKASLHMARLNLIQTQFLLAVPSVLGCLEFEPSSVRLAVVACFAAVRDGRNKYLCMATVRLTLLYRYIEFWSKQKMRLAWGRNYGIDKSKSSVRVLF